MSWKPEVFVDGGWHTNALRFETEANDYAQDLHARWLLAERWRSVECGDEVNTSGQ